jgi:beta-lactamase regulating signal transducer with metallopeptidase domain
MVVAGWFLVHAVWQVALVGVWTMATLAMLRRQRAHLRYVVACSGFLAMPVVPALTVLWSRPAANPMGPWLVSAPSVVAVAGRLAESAAPWMPMVVVAWLSGVALLSCRLFVGWRALRRLVRDHVFDVPAEWQARASELADRMGLSTVVRFGQTARIDVPCVVGWLRPLVLVPTSVLGGLAPTQLEAILAHELAHIRRHDALMNLVQLAVEALLYFHPAMWWLSRRVRIEREQCCDDLALAAVPDHIDYARALAELERLREHAWRQAVAASDGDLLSRIRRVVHPRPPSTARPPLVRAVVGASGLGLVVLLAATTLAAGPWLAVGHWSTQTPAAPALWMGALLGFTVGLRHAFEADHVITVATLVTGEHSAGAGARLGATWGAGHAVALGAAAAVLIGVRATMPDPLTQLFEFCVSAMLVLLGARAIQRGLVAARGGPVVEHVHGSHVHAHATDVAHVHIGPLVVARRPLVVGIVHGLAGSGSLTALAVANLPTAVTQAAFIIMFALGSTLAMAGFSGFAGWPLARLAQSPRFMATLSMASGLISIALGVALGQ